MKTIKELEAEIKKIEVSIENTPLTTDKFRDGFKKIQLKQAELKALKDVLGLINELEDNDASSQDIVEELKSKIEG